MGKVLNCECGVTVRGENDDDVLEKAIEHLEGQHPDVAATVTPAQVMSMMEEE